MSGEAPITQRLCWQHLGRAAYGPTLRLQLALWEAVRDGARPPTLLTLEHDPVITLGKRAADSDVKLSEELLAQRGIELFRVERGGQATYHGPGQLVFYAIVDVRRRSIGVSDLVRGLAASIADELSTLSIDASYDGDNPGLWTDGAKIAAVGMRVKQGTSYHGAALNVSTALDAFEAIVPCGMPEARTTRVLDYVSEAPELPELARAVGERFAGRMKLTLEPVDNLRPLSVDEGLDDA